MDHPLAQPLRRGGAFLASVAWRSVLGGYFLLLASTIWFIKSSYLPALWLDPVFGVYSLCVTVYLLSRFSLSLLYRPVRRGPDQLPTVAVVIPAILVATSFYYGGLDHGWSWSTLPAMFARVGFGFPAGVLIHKLFVAGRRAPPVSGLLLLAVLAVVMLAWRPMDALRPYWEAFFVLILCPLFVWFGASASDLNASMYFCATK